MNRAGKPEETELSAKVLEYYRLHSQNNELTKYFCGTTTDHLIPNIPISTSDSSLQPQTARNDESNIPTIHIDDGACELDTTRIPSPTSSIASHRRLEWDNGADIGYENYSNKTLQKSLSLPVLSAIRIQEDMASDKTSSSDTSTNSSNKSKPDRVTVKSSILLTDFISSSSQDSEHNNETILKFLRSKVGYPNAESTPYEKVEVMSRKSDHVDTPTTSKRSQQENLKYSAKNSSLQPEIINPTTNENSKAHSDACSDLSSSLGDTDSKKTNSNEKHIKTSPIEYTPAKPSSASGKSLKYNLETSFFMYEIPPQHFSKEVMPSSYASSNTESKTTSKSGIVHQASSDISSKTQVTSKSDIVHQSSSDSTPDIQFTSKSDIVHQSSSDSSPNLQINVTSKSDTVQQSLSDSSAVSQTKIISNSNQSSSNSSLNIQPKITSLLDTVKQSSSNTFSNTQTKYTSKYNTVNNSLSNTSSDTQPKIASKLDQLSDTNSPSNTKVQSGSFSDDTVRKWSSDLDFTLPQRVKYFNRYRNRKIKNLSVSVPVYVECIGANAIQSNASIGIQTEPIPRATDKKRAKQEVRHMIYSDEKEASSSNTTTESDDKDSNCSSFEFLYGSVYNSLKTAVEGSNIKVDEVVNEYLTKNLKRTPVKKNLSNITSSSEKSTASSQENYLSNLLAQHQLNTTEIDVKKSLTLIHKLQKSKKYNEETKKHYTKKILKQLLKNIKTNDDSSMSSEQISPNIENKMPSRDYTSSVTTHEQLHSNVPWTPVQNLKGQDINSNKLSKNNQFSIPTTSQYIDNYNTNSTLSQSSNKYYERNLLQKHFVTTSDTDLSQPKSFASTDANKSWKENKTISERILEQFNAGGDNTNYGCFARNERKQQLDWIQNEIQHLQKLKDLLENKKKATVSDKAGFDKSTSVYMITTERSTDDDGRPSKVDYVKGITDPNELREINLRLHENLGTKDYKIKEIITKVLPNESSTNKIPKQINKSNSVPVDRAESIKLADTNNVIESDYKLSSDDNDVNKRVYINADRNDKPITIYNNQNYMESSAEEGIKEHTLKVRKCDPKCCECECPPPCETDNVARRTTVLFEGHIPKNEFGRNTEIQISNGTSNRGGFNCIVNCRNCKDKIKLSPANNGIVISSKGDERLNFNKAKVTECVSNKNSNVKTIILEIPINGNDSMDTPRLSNQSSTLHSHSSQSQPPETSITNDSMNKPRPSNPQSTSHKRPSQSQSPETSITNDSKNKPRPSNQQSTSHKRPSQSQPPETIANDSMNRPSSSNQSSTSHKRPSQSQPAETTNIKDSVDRPRLPHDSMDRPRLPHDSVDRPRLPHDSLDRPRLPHHPSTSHKRPSKPQPPDTSIASETSVSSSETIVLCSCCKKCLDGSKTSLSLIPGTGRAFCPPCHQQSQIRNWNNDNPYFDQPQHRCICYSQLNQLRDTVEELKLLDECYDQYCECLNPQKYKNRCAICNCKVKSSNNKKEPLAFVLTFESGNEEAPSLRKANTLEEICMKIPHTHHSGKSKRKHKGSYKYKDTTVQDYLASNRPEFIKSAEQRRKCMIDLAYMREQRCQKYKQLLALSNGIPMQNPGYLDMQKKRLFSVKEMKSMTAKKYKTLPEVQQKLVENKDRQIKKANRLLADIFNKKLRENVLRGCPTIGADISVINLT